jgi:alpha-glucosidase (family GH31 glycosyl hydrolase)
MYDYGEYVSPNAVAFDGTKGEELHNAYPIQYQKVAYDFFMSKVRIYIRLTIRIHVPMCT